MIYNKPVVYIINVAIAAFSVSMLVLILMINFRLQLKYEADERLIERIEKSRGICLSR